MGSRAYNEGFGGVLGVLADIKGIRRENPRVLRLKTQFGRQGLRSQWVRMGWDTIVVSLWKTGQQQTTIVVHKTTVVVLQCTTIVMGHATIVVSYCVGSYCLHSLRLRPQCYGLRSQFNIELLCNSSNQSFCVKELGSKEGQSTVNNQKGNKQEEGNKTVKLDQLKQKQIK